MNAQITRLNEAFATGLGIQGRMISGSKSAYREAYPENEIYFNANIFIVGEGKVWYGDVDITLDTPKLIAIANTIGKNLYILREYDGRFGNDELSEADFIKKAVATIEPSR